MACASFCRAAGISAGGDLRAGRLHGHIAGQPAIGQRRCAIDLRTGQHLGKLGIALQREALCAIGQVHPRAQRVGRLVTAAHRNIPPRRAAAIGFELQPVQRGIGIRAIAFVLAGPGRVGHPRRGDGGGGGGLVEAKLARDDRRPGSDIAFTHLRRHLGQLILACLPLRRPQDLRQRPAHRHRQRERRGQIHPGGFIPRQGGRDIGPGIGAQGNRHQPGTARAQRQHVAERRRIANIGQQRTGPGAVQPQAFATHGRPHEDMIERPRRRQSLRHPVAELAVGQQRLRFDS